MSWVRIDDTAWDHPKHVAAGPMAFALWVWGLLYCSRHLTDGRIPDDMLARSGVPKARAIADRLVINGLWIRDGSNAYRVHDYADFQPLAENVDAKKKAHTERMSAWRAAKRAKRDARDASVTVPQHDHNAACDSVRDEVVTSFPSHPILVPPNPQRGERPTRADDDAAGWLCRSYPTWYAEERNGATYRMQPTLDWSAALGLTETWPDRKHLERMARTFLRATNLPAAHANRSLVTFARQYASACDAQVRAGGAA